MTKLTKRSIKVQVAGVEYPITVGTKDAVSKSKNPFFSRLIKITQETNALGAPEVGSEVAYMDDVFMSSSNVFAFGTVTKITAINLYISVGKNETRRTPDRVRRIG